ncbi:helix-turn-helix domain-containing protein [Qipengyuania profunda]|uniref:helix-turn-helix domain-containing protein n=1 Tax=Qipengyuania profunda TaxID=3113984 RepID=UPI003B588003
MRRTTTTVPGFSLEAVGRRLRDARKAAGLTQEEFAEASGFNKSSVIAWESGRNSPLRRCLRACGSSVTYPPNGCFADPALSHSKTLLLRNEIELHAPKRVCETWLSPMD